MTDDDSRAQNDGASDAEPKRTYPDYLLRHGRERGLSKADRRYLASGGATVENQGTDVNTRIRIRERIRESIVDFWLITEYLSDYDRDLIFRESDEEWDDWELQIGLKNAVQFFYGALGESDLTDFETILESAIHDHERNQADGPVDVNVDLDVEVEQQFAITDAYEKFQHGEPMTPTEVGVLLISGQVQDLELVGLLAKHARMHGELSASIAPLLAQQLAQIRNKPKPQESFDFLLPGAEPEPGQMDAIDDVAWQSDYQYLENAQEHANLIEQSDKREPGAFCRWNGEIAEKIANYDQPEEEWIQSRRRNDLQALSVQLGKRITVGDDVVYEEGERRILDDGDEKGADSPASTDDDGDDTEP